MLLARRAWTVVRFERKRRRQRSEGRTLDAVRVDGRTIDVYSSSACEGTPFTGGILRPYICFPESTLATLSPEEKKAVTCHEIAHVKTWDLLITYLIRSLGDLLWFVPGYRFLARKIDRLREILADEAAVRLGASPEHLASALLKLREIPEGRDHAILHSAFLREKSLLRSRVERLLGESPASSPRLGWRWLPVRLAATAWITGAVMIATLAGNHEESVRELPPWLEELLKRWFGHEFF